MIEKEEKYDEKKFTDLRYFLRTKAANLRWAMDGDNFHTSKDCPDSRTALAASLDFHLKWQEMQTENYILISRIILLIMIHGILQSAHNKVV